MLVDKYCLMGIGCIGLFFLLIYLCVKYHPEEIPRDETPEQKPDIDLFKTDKNEKTGD